MSDVDLAAWVTAYTLLAIGLPVYGIHLSSAPLNQHLIINDNTIEQQHTRCVFLLDNLGFRSWQPA